MSVLSQSGRVNVRVVVGLGFCSVGLCLAVASVAVVVRSNQGGRTVSRLRSGSARSKKRVGPTQVILTEFSDFQCPYCARVQPTLAQIRDTYKDKVKIVYKDFPLRIHNNAPKAAEAARCVFEQDKEKYWAYHDKLFDNAQALAVENLKQYAVDLQFNAATFNTCLDSGKYAAAVTQDMAGGLKVGISGTPAFLVNGRFLAGAQPFSAFQEAIDDALAAP